MLNSSVSGRRIGDVLVEKRRTAWTTGSSLPRLPQEPRLSHCSIPKDTARRLLQAWKNTVGDRYIRIFCAYVTSHFCYFTFENKKLHCSASSVPSDKDIFLLVPPLLIHLLLPKSKWMKAAGAVQSKDSYWKSVESPYWELLDTQLLVACCLYNGALPPSELYECAQEF